jgi:hypothetical protein
MGIAASTAPPMGPVAFSGTATTTTLSGRTTGGATATVAVARIRIDPTWRLLPDLDEREYAALVEDVRRRGVQVPLEVDAESGAVLDGHHRLRAAAACGQAVVPIRLRRFPSDDERVRHVLALNVLRRHLRPEQRRELVAWLRGERHWSGPKIAAALSVARSTVYRDLQALDAAPGGPGAGFAEPAVVEGKGRRGQRPYRRRVGRRPPTGGLLEAALGRAWVPEAPEDAARLVKTATTELRRWLTHHGLHLAAVPDFTVRFAPVVAAIERLP